MTASVTSGFAPAALSIVTASGAAATPDAEGGEPGLFAALLALVGAQQPETTPTTPEVAPAAPLIDLAPAAATKQGKSLLKDLGDALIAINDALAAGKPVDPALEKKLADSLDAMAVYLGTLTPPATSATPVDPRITALASGDGIIPPPAPVLPEPTPETAPTTEPAPETSETADVPAIEAAPAETAPVISIPAALAALVDEATKALGGAPAAAAATPAQVTQTDTPPEPAPTPPALAKLAQYVEAIGKTLAVQSPELGAKLQELAKSLASGAVPPELLAKLSGDAAADPEIARIIDALAAQRPEAAKPTPPAPFVAPSLVLPEAVAKSNKPAAEPPATPQLAATDPAPPRDADSVRRTMVVTKAAPEKPVDPEAKPAAASTTPTPPTAADPTGTPTPAPLLAAGAAAAARTVHAAYQVPVQQLNVPQVAFEVVRQFEAGSSRFQIRLDPAELGRIDVRLDVDKSGTISARMTVERPETLDLLQRDQRALQQALQQAGLDSSKTNLEFSLRQNPFAQQGGMADGQGGNSGFNNRGDSFGGGDEIAAEAATTTYRGKASASGVNLFV